MWPFAGLKDSSRYDLSSAQCIKDVYQEITQNTGKSSRWLKDFYLNVKKEIEMKFWKVKYIGTDGKNSFACYPRPTPKDQSTSNFEGVYLFTLIKSHFRKNNHGAGKITVCIAWGSDEICYTYLNRILPKGVHISADSSTNTHNLSAHSKPFLIRLASQDVKGLKYRAIEDPIRRIVVAAIRANVPLKQPAIQQNPNNGQKPSFHNTP